MAKKKHKLRDAWRKAGKDIGKAAKKAGYAVKHPLDALKNIANKVGTAAASAVLLPFKGLMIKQLEKRGHVVPKGTHMDKIIVAFHNSIVKVHKPTTRHLESLSADDGANIAEGAIDVAATAVPGGSAISGIIKEIIEFFKNMGKKKKQHEEAVQDAKDSGKNPPPDLDSTTSEVGSDVNSYQDKEAKASGGIDSNGNIYDTKGNDVTEKVLTHPANTLNTHRGGLLSYMHRWSDNLSKYQKKKEEERNRRKDEALRKAQKEGADKLMQSIKK